MKTRFFGILRSAQKPDYDAPNEAVETPKESQYIKEINVRSANRPVASKNVVKDYSHYRSDKRDNDMDEI